MVYNTGQTGIDDTRIGTGNLLPTDYPDAQITKKINSAFSKVQLAAKRKLTEPFAATDTEYDYCRELELKIAARDCLKAYGPEFLEKIKELDEEIKDDIAFLIDNLQVAPTAEEADIMLAVTPYLSYGALLEEDPDSSTLIPYRGGVTDQV